MIWIPTEKISKEQGMDVLVGMKESNADVGTVDFSIGSSMPP